MSTDSYEERNGRRVVQISDAEPERPELSRREERRQKRALGNIRSQGPKPSIAGNHYSIAHEAEQIVNGAFGPFRNAEGRMDRDSPAWQATVAFKEKHRVYPDDAVLRYKEHGNIQDISTAELSRPGLFMPTYRTSGRKRSFPFYFPF